MYGLKLTTKPIRILDFDIENRPLSYWVPDRPTADVTAIAWSWSDEEEVHARLYDGSISSKINMLLDFGTAYDNADIVTGHYIRRHDLPILQSEYMELGMLGLGPKMTIDTRLDMIKKGDMPATQEHLADMLGIEAPKVHMTQMMWREANRLTPKGLKATEKRVKGDVIQHKQLRFGMQSNGWLKAPKVWRP